MSIFCQFSSLTSSIYWQIQYKTKKLNTNISWKPYVRFPSNKNYIDQCTQSDMMNLFKWSYSQFLFSWNIVSNLLNAPALTSIQPALCNPPALMGNFYTNLKPSVFVILLHWRRTPLNCIKLMRLYALYILTSNSPVLNPLYWRQNFDRHAFEYCQYVKLWSITVNHTWPNY